MPCDECKRLDDAVAYALRALQEQRQVGISGKPAREVQRDLKHAYNLALAELRLHMALCHPETGHKVTGEDMCITIRKGRNRA